MRPDYEYVEVPETIAASFADSLPARFFEEIPGFRGGGIRSRSETRTERVLRLRSARLLTAQETYERIIAKFTGKTSKSAKKWRVLRAENQRRHDLAASLGHWPMSHTV